MKYSKLPQKFGIRVPKMVEEAISIDQETYMTFYEKYKECC
jgi:hypothetical protein